MVDHARGLRSTKYKVPKVPRTPHRRVLDDMSHTIVLLLLP